MLSLFIPIATLLLLALDSPHSGSCGAITLTLFGGGVPQRKHGLSKLQPHHQQALERRLLRLFLLGIMELVKQPHERFNVVPVRI
jgi:hypothetical protein